MHSCLISVKVKAFIWRLKLTKLADWGSLSWTLKYSFKILIFCQNVVWPDTFKWWKWYDTMMFHKGFETDITESYVLTNLPHINVIMKWTDTIIISACQSDFDLLHSIIYWQLQVFLSGQKLQDSDNVQPYHRGSSTPRHFCVVFV